MSARIVRPFTEVSSAAVGTSVRLQVILHDLETESEVRWLLTQCASIEDLFADGRDLADSFVAAFGRPTVDAFVAVLLSARIDRCNGSGESLFPRTTEFAAARYCAAL